MHSSRMRTVRWSGRLPWGRGCLPGGGSAQGGGVCPGDVCPGVCVCGECLAGGYVCRGGLPGGVSGGRGGGCCAKNIRFSSEQRMSETQSQDKFQLVLIEQRTFAVSKTSFSLIMWS